MGDAYTALAEDEFTLFYNPALMGRHKGVTLNAVNFELAVTNVLDETDRFDDFPESDPALITERVLGFPLHFQVAGTPSLKFEHFGLNFLANASSTLSLTNAIHPILDIDYRYDRGFITGFAYNFEGSASGSRRYKKKDSGFGNGRRTSVGLGVKHITREGLANSYPIYGTTLLNEIANNDNKDFYDIREALGFAKGKAWGFDAGFDQTFSSRFSQFGWGLSAMNIGGMKFTRFEGTDEIPEQDMIMRFGTVWRQDFGLFGYALTFDLHPMNLDLPFMRMAHFGVLIDLPIVDFMFGINEGYGSFGVEIELFVFKLMAGFYSVELGREVKEIEAKRGILYLSLLDISFDG